MNDWTVRIAESPIDYERVSAFFGGIEGPQEQAYCQRRLAFSRYRPEFTRFIESDGQVVCAALLRHDRWLVDGVALDSGFLENILTHPKYRQRGLFTALLNDCLRFLLAEGFPLATLHGAINRYAHFGYEPVRHHAAVTLPAEVAAGLPPAGRPRPFTPADLGDIAALYAATYSQLAATEERTAGVWQWLLPTMDDVLVLEDPGGLLIAYAWISQRLVQQKLRVIEAAAADGRAALSLLAALGARAGQAGLPTVYLALPPDHPLARMAVARGGEARLVGPVVLHSHWGHADQARVLDLGLALQALAPALNQRLACSTYAGWTGNVAIDTEQGSASLEISAGSVQAAPRDGVTQGVLRLPARLLAPLFLGTYGARELVAWPKVSAATPLLGLLNILFPPRWPVSENEDWWIETN